MAKFNLDLFSKDNNYIIEASAGTGKTYSITKMVAKLVLKQGVPLDKILIVTYTEKAAGELKDRIRSELKGINVDNASIYTIHSFCMNSIKEFGLSAGKAFGLEVIDEGEMEDFVNQFIRKGDIFKDIETIISCNDKIKPKKELNLNTLVDQFISGVKSYYLDYNGNAVPSVINLKRTFEDRTLQMAVDHANMDWFGFIAKYPDVGDAYEGLQYIDEKAAQTLYDKIAADKLKFRGNKSYNVLDGNDDYEYLLKIKKMVTEFKCNIYLAEKYLPSLYMVWQEEKAMRKAQTFDDMIRTVRESVMKDGSPFLAKLQEKYSHAIIDEFQDTNQKQFDIFGKIFCSDEDHHIIVVGDAKQSIYAFQGADVNVFNNAVRDIASSGGNQRVLSKNYRSSKAVVDACNNLFPHFNFVGTVFSPSEAIDGLVCKEDDGKEHRATFDGAEAKPFWVIDSNEEEAEVVKEDNFAISAVRKIIDCCTYDKDGKTRLQISQKGGEFRNATFKDFTVLAKTRSEMVDIERVMKKVGIPCSRYKDQGLFKGKECAHWLALLKALDCVDFTGKNRQVFKKAMFTNFFGYGLEELTNSRFDKDDTDEAKLFVEWKRIAADGRWEDLFGDIILNSKLSESTSGLSNLQSLSVYKQIGDYCIEYLYNNHTISDLIKHLTTLSKGNSDDDTESNGSLVERRTNFDSVQVMTMHASKGLQFPVVIPVGGFKHPKKASESYKYHNKDDFGNPVQYLTFNKDDGQYPNPDDPKHPFNKITDEEEAEAKRLFYVAYTRAQFVMILPHYGNFGIEFLNNTLNKYLETKPSECLISPVLPKKTRYYDWRGEVATILEKSKTAVATADNVTSDIQNAVMKGLIKDQPNKMTYQHSYTSLSHPSVHDDDRGEEDGNKEGYAIMGLGDYDLTGVSVSTAVDASKEPYTMPVGFPRGAKIGSALHKVFELADYTTVGTSLPNGFDRLIESAFNSEGVRVRDEDDKTKYKEDWMDYVRSIVINTLNAKFPGINGTSSFKLNEITNDNKKAEMEFDFNLLGDKLKNFSTGFIDLLIRRGDKFSIIDWKSDTLNDEDLISYSDCGHMKQHVDNCYSIQRVLYSYTLVKLITQWMHISEEEAFNNHFGGVYYVFIRGCEKDTGNGIYAHTWNSWSDLESAFNKIIDEKVGGAKHE